MVEGGKSGGNYFDGRGIKSTVELIFSMLRFCLCTWTSIEPK